MPQRWDSHILVALGVVFVLSTSALAQKTTGDITGTVTDSTGAVLPGASVTAVCTDTNLTRAAATDPQGGYSLPELPICVYKVSVELQGFKSITRDVQVAANAVAKTDFRLEVGAQSETITVEGVSPLVEFSDKLNSYIDKQRIDAIPLSGRDFNSLLSVTPGVQHTPGGGFLAVNASGARTTSNNFMIDGISNNDRYYGDTVLNQTGVVGVPATLVPMDAMAEFSVQQTPSAEFGVKGGAAINVVMKSGSNQLHGSGYYFRHDDWTDSTNFFVKQSGGSTTPVKNQQYGGTFGGPIKKDKMFFFGYYEGQRLAVTSPFSVNVPKPTAIAAARARIAADGLQTTPIGENLLKYYPTDPSGSLTIQSPNVSNMSTFSVKIDHQLNPNNLINERFFFGTNYQSAPAGNSGYVAPPSLPVDYFNSVADPTRVYLVGFVWNSTLSAKTLLETRFGFNSISQTIGVNNSIDPQSLGVNTGPLAPANFGVPNVTLASFGLIGGIGGYPITTAPTTTTEVTSSLIHTRGQQTMKLGGSFQYGYNRSVRDRARSSFVITGTPTGAVNSVDALTALLLGRFDSATRSFGSTERHMHQTSFAGFINDDWKVSARLTLSAGLRYDIFLPIGERDNLASNFIPGQGLVQVGHGIDSIYNADPDNFGPRAGLAWDVMGDGKTSVRAGYALTYDPMSFRVIHSPTKAGSMSNPDLGVFSVTFNGAVTRKADDPLATCINPNNPSAGGDYVCVQPGASIYGTSPGGSPPFDAFAVPQNLQSPMYHYFHASFQRELVKGNAVTVSYVGSRGRDLLFVRDLNAPPLGSPFATPQPFRPYNAQFPNLRQIISLTNDGQSWYDSLQVSYRQYGWHGINSQYNYTLANCQDYNSSNTPGRNDFPQADNPYNPAANKGPCGYDVRHNFNVGGSYAIPESAKLGGVGNGWQVATVFTATSGRPFTPNLGSFDRSGQGTGWMRANCLADPIYDFTNPNAIITNASAAFAVPANGTLGTCGRNSARLPRFAQWDLNVIKQFKLQGNRTIQARWEVFNLLNRVNFASLQSTSVRSAAFGAVQDTPDVNRGNPVIAAGGPRAMQWAVKFLF